MDFFISNAWAQSAPPEQPGILEALLPFIILFVIFYFLLIRPQQKRAKEHKQMVANISKGDEVVTNGGLLGKIVEVGDNFIELEVNENNKVKVQRQMIANVVPKGTIRSL
ncbi:MAG TPA: preprotein translocase subunit YajC [Gammaproteobacteria bacterium]|nr:preprotein translocase subunit YajC [Gammaproteobacteria bacterium]